MLNAAVAEQGETPVQLEHPGRMEVEQRLEMDGLLHELWQGLQDLQES